MMKRQCPFPKFNMQPVSRGGLSRNGFTLMEMMVGLAIGCLGIFIFSSAVLKAQSSEAWVETSAARGELALAVRRTILDRRSLTVTVAMNPVLKAVVHNDYSGAVSSANSGQFYGIDLYDSSQKKIAGADADATHPTASPVYYTTDGYPCATLGVGKCFISVKASFMFQGHPVYSSYHDVVPTVSYPAWDSRLTPDFLQFNYSIVYDDATPGITRKPVEGSVFINYDDLGI